LGSRRWLFFFILIYLALAAARSWADRPGCDEGWFASPAYNLINHGTMNTTVFETEGTPFKGLTRYTYWIMPIYPIALAIWFKIWGFGLYTMRVPSILFGCGVVYAWYWIIVKLLRNRAAAIVTAGLLACDFVVVRSGAFGRPDMLCALFGFGGIAAYLILRERSMTSAAVASHALVAGSIFTHPNGVMHFLALMFLMFYLDWKHVRFSHLLLGAVPYLIIGTCWGVYISRAPDLFVSQFGANASGRASGVRDPLLALRREIHVKYLSAATTLGAALPRIALMVFYAIAVIGCLAVRALRQDVGVKALLVITGIYFTYGVLFDGLKPFVYLLHIVPYYIALFGVLVTWLWSTRKLPRAVPAAIVAALVLVQISGTAYTVLRNSYHNDFLPAANFLRQNMTAGQWAIGTAEFAFPLGFDGAVLDDPRIGVVSTKRADFAIVDTRYEDYLNGDPEARDVLNRNYSPVYKHGSFSIYARRH
jgi:4-amino-4-deoxy-L-arabinose transferase-like glycosyltransferase